MICCPHAYNISLTQIPTLHHSSDFGDLGHLRSQNDVIMPWLMLTATSNCFPHPYWTQLEWLSPLMWSSWAYIISLTQLYPHYLGQILGLWVTCRVKMMWLCHVWCWQQPQTASYIHIRHIQSTWAHCYPVYMHTVAAFHIFTHTTWLRFWGSGSLVESKWCIFVMVDADSHLKLLPISILDTYEVIEHIDMLSMGIQYQPYTVMPTLLDSNFRALGQLWSQNDKIMLWLRLTVTSRCFSHPY